MTIVHVRLARGDGATFFGSLTMTPTRRHELGTTLVTTAAYNVALNGTALTDIDMPPTASDWCWTIQENVPGGAIRTVAVPGSGPVEYEALVDVDPKTLSPAALPEAAWWTAFNNIGTNFVERPAPTRNSLTGWYHADGFGLATTNAGSVNDTALATALATMASGDTLYIPPGSYSIANTIAVPAGVRIRTDTAVITQTTSSKISVTLAAGATWRGGTLVGKGSDYVAGVSSPTAIGVKATASGASVQDVTISNHAGAGIYLLSAANFRASNVTITGVGPGITIPAVDNACFGVYASSGCTGMSFNQVEISNASIGFIASSDSTHLSLTGMRVHDIPGQHGIYLQNGTGLHVDGVDVYNCHFNGVKLQLLNTSPADSVGAVFANITADTCGDTALIIYNTDTALTYKIHGVSVNNLVATNCDRGLYLGSVRTGTVSNIAVSACTGDGITILDCWDLTGSNVNVETAGKDGIRVSSVTNGTNNRITLDGVAIRNAANTNTASFLYGIFVNDSTDLTINNLKVTCTNGFMVYGLYFAGGDQASFTLRNAALSGDTGTSVRLLAGPTAVKEWHNVSTAGTVLNFPTTLITRTSSAGSSNTYAGPAAPASGTYLRGDIVVNNAPATVGDTYAWICVTAGTPGTWTTIPTGPVGPAADVQVFTSSGTWTKPGGITLVSSVVVSGGSGAGSGRRGAAGSVRCGGGGGGAGALSTRTMPASACGATETVTVGAGGGGGAAVTANDTDGNAGTAGALSLFGLHVIARAPTAGAGGTNATGTAGAGGSGVFNGGAGGAASTTGAVGTAASTAPNAGGGGGGGGGITSGDSPSAGGAGAIVGGRNGAASVGGAINTSATASANSPANSGEPGCGGGGGGGSIVGVAGSGAAGALYGAGGGGGGASLNGNNSGAGGAGANGIVIVISQ